LGREGLAPNQRFAVWPGRESVVGWTTGSFALERTVLFPTDATFERVELRLPSQPRLGRARIDVRDARGQPFGERYQIAVESLAGAQELLSVSSDGPSTSIELPEGRHLLIVATQALAPFLQSLDVEADRTTQVEVVLRPGGSLNLLVEADVDPLQDPRGGPDPLLRARAEWITHGRAVPLGFLDPRHPAARPRTFFAATLLTTGITRLPAGRQVVEVTLDGFEPRRVEVDVVEGQAADVTVRLERP
jgi:hypothetical protein